jgi:hypothetical protein
VIGGVSTWTALGQRRASGEANCWTVRQILVSDLSDLSDSASLD